MKVSQVKDAVKIGELLKKRAELINDAFKLESVKHGKLIMKFGSEEFIFPLDEGKRVIENQIRKNNKELEDVRMELLELNIEEDVEW